MATYTLNTYTNVNSKISEWQTSSALPGECGIEPGDGTHYTIAVYDRRVLFFVGRHLDDSRRPMLVILEFAPGVEPYIVMSTESCRDYERDVAVFFAGLFAGFEMDEPEVLACRRNK